MPRLTGLFTGSLTASFTGSPAAHDPRAFDELHDVPERWRGVVEALGAPYGNGPVLPMLEGTALVALIGQALVLKLYPPFLQDHFEFEHAMLGQVLAGRAAESLAVPTPRLVASGTHEGWPYLVMTQLRGQVLTGLWPTLDEGARCRLLRQIGRVTAQVHALPATAVATMARFMPAGTPDWPSFLLRQRQNCLQRQQRTGLPAHLLAQLPAFIDGPVPQGPAVVLTGEYTPMNLLADPAAPGTEAGTLSGMFDFGDGLVGPREYDWLGPLTFLAAGHAERLDAYFEGYGIVFPRQRREELLRLLLLHRYSALRFQIACPGWDEAPDFAALALRIWP